MSNAFNPFQPPATPVQAPAAAVQPQRAIPQGLNDDGMYDGFSTPFFKHVEGDWDVKITGYTGARTPKLGIACHITFEVLKSSCPDQVPVGSTWRIAYKYDFERRAKADLDTYGSDARSLGQFVQALFNQSRTQSGFDVISAEASLHKHDFTTQPGQVHLTGTLGKPKEKKAPTGGTEVKRFRNDLWTPARAL